MTKPVSLLIFRAVVYSAHTDGSLAGILNRSVNLSELGGTVGGKSVICSKFWNMRENWTVIVKYVAYVFELKVKLRLL